MVEPKWFDRARADLKRSLPVRGSNGRLCRDAAPASSCRPLRPIPSCALFVCANRRGEPRFGCFRLKPIITYRYGVLLSLWVTISRMPRLSTNTTRLSRGHGVPSECNYYKSALVLHLLLDTSRCPWYLPVRCLVPIIYSEGEYRGFCLSWSSRIGWSGVLRVDAVRVCRIMSRRYGGSRA